MTWKSYYIDPELFTENVGRSGLQNHDVLEIIGANAEIGSVVWCVEDDTGRRVEWDTVEDWIRITNG